jgi:hypothetical protein
MKPHVLQTQTRLNIILSNMYGSIIPLKSKLYYDENSPYKFFRPSRTHPLDPPPYAVERGKTELHEGRG